LPSFRITDNRVSSELIDRLARAIAKCEGFFITKHKPRRGAEVPHPSVAKRESG